jgi:hypothetical protein
VPVAAGSIRTPSKSSPALHCTPRSCLSDHRHMGGRGRSRATVAKNWHWLLAIPDVAFSRIAWHSIAVGVEETMRMRFREANSLTVTGIPGRPGVDSHVLYGASRCPGFRFVRVPDRMKDIFVHDTVPSLVGRAGPELRAPLSARSQPV